MADYHPLIARAVAGLEKNTGENRRALYERARIALVAQLRGVVPALEESEITRERLALEEAIRKVEAEAARQARETARPSLIKRAETPRREELPRPAPRPPDHAGARHRRADEFAGSRRRPKAPPPPPPALRLPFTRPTLQDEALKGFRDGSQQSRDAARGPRRPRRRLRRDPGAPDPALPLPPQQPPPPPERHPLEEYGQLEPQVQPENLWALPLDGTQRRGAGRPRCAAACGAASSADDEADEPLPPRRPPRSYGKLIRTGLVLALILAVGSLVYWQRSNIVDVGGRRRGVVPVVKPPPPREAAAPARPKITDRIGQPSTQPSSGPPVAQRVVLYEEEPDDPQGKRFIGTVVWRTEMRPATPGRPPELAVRADIDVPERKMSVTLSLRRNTDQSLPASHTIEIVFNAARRFRRRAACRRCPAC